MATDDPPHDRVEAEPVGIVYVVVPAKASENGLAGLPYKTVTTVLPTTGVHEYVPGTLGQSDRIIQLPVRQQHPASEVTLAPWNSSLSRRSKSSLRTPSFDSPIG